VCSPSGKVVRIVIFRKASLLHAMVEFDSVETASHAKRYDFFEIFTLLRIPDPLFLSALIQDPTSTTREVGEQIVVLIFFVVTNLK
jgi:hypothetical protein